ncbi:hypothetical protein TNCV_4192571 [Trichonephila clavipes]|nr:hypothetical protein TNCV_4192571 [Trichonephila clavipes]
MWLALALSTMHVTILLSSTPIFRKNILGEGSETSHLFLLSTFLTRGLVARWLFRTACREGTIHLQTSMPSPRFETRPYGISVGFTNHCAGWVVPIVLIYIINFSAFAFKLT